MKIIIVIKLVFFFLILVSYSCSESGINNPETPTSGVTGKVLDIAGKPINTVSVYYLFNYNYVPNYSPLKVTEISGADSFGFSFYQNFPNPVYNSSFVRFSIPDDMDIELTLKDLVSGSMKFTLSGFYYYGFYQHHFNEIVISSNLENSCYLIKFRALKNGVLMFDADKKLTIVSDIGKPNATSNDKGIYSFDYRKACIGDTIFSTTNGNNIYPYEITNHIYLLFKKDGYLPEIIEIDLYPDLLLSRDVVLRKEE